MGYEDKRKRNILIYKSGNLVKLTEKFQYLYNYEKGKTIIMGTCISYDFLYPFQ